MEIKAKLLDISEKESLSRQELAEIMGVTEAQIGYYLTGVNEPRKGRLVKLAKHLNRPVSIFYSDEPYEKLTLVGKDDGRSLKKENEDLREIVALRKQLDECREENRLLRTRMASATPVEAESELKKNKPTQK